MPSPSQSSCTVTAVAPFVIDVQNHTNSSSITRHFFKGEDSDVGSRDSDGGCGDGDDRRCDSDDGHEDCGNLSLQLDSLDLKWVVVRYPGQKNAKTFVGQVLGTDATGRVTVKFLKRVKFGKFVWPDIDDNDCIDRACVTKVLPEPQMDRRSRIAFPIGID